MYAVAAKLLLLWLIPTGGYAPPESDAKVVQQNLAAWKESGKYTDPAPGQENPAVATEQEVLRLNLQYMACVSNLKKSCGDYKLQEVRCEKCVTDNSFVQSVDGDSGTVSSWSKCTSAALGEYCWGKDASPWPKHEGALVKSAVEKLGSNNIGVNPHRSCLSLYQQFCGLMKLDGPSSCLSCLEAKSSDMKEDSPTLGCADTHTLRTMFCQRSETGKISAAIKTTQVYFSLQVGMRIHEWQVMQDSVLKALAVELKVPENSLTVEKLQFLDHGEIRINYKLRTDQDASRAIDILNSQRATAKLVRLLSKMGGFDWEGQEERSMISNVLVNKPTFVYTGRNSGRIQHLKDASRMVAELHDIRDRRKSLSVIYEIRDAGDDFPKTAEPFFGDAFKGVLLGKGAVKGEDIENINVYLMTPARQSGRPGTTKQVAVLVELVSHAAARSLLNVLLRHSYTETVSTAFKSVLAEPSVEVGYKIFGMKLVGISFAHQFHHHDEGPSLLIPHLITLAFVVGAASGCLGIHRLAKQRVAMLVQHEVQRSNFQFDGSGEQMTVWSNVDTGRCESPDLLINDDSDDFYKDKRLHLI
jgi:hypothetical protein